MGKTIIPDPYEELLKATKAIKIILNASEETIEKLPPVERLLAREIRKAAGDLQ